jgi:hypothetical protein
MRAKISTETVAANASRFLWAAGLIFLLGSLADLVLVWGLQGPLEGAEAAVREFETLAATVESTPRIVLAAGLIGAAMTLRGTRSAFTLRVLSITVLLLGLAGAVIGAMVVSDYFVVRPLVVAGQERIFLTKVLKALTLAGLHVLVLIPVGVMGLRRSRG